VDLSRSGNDGTVSHEDSTTGIRLLGQEVMPRPRDIGRNLGLTDPFAANAPTSLQFPEPAYVPAEALAPKAEAAAD
jgi:hypothetical protein